MGFPLEVAIVGGCGRVGLPLGLAFADRARTVVLYDVDASRAQTVQAGRMPFAERSAEEVLARCKDLLTVTTDPAAISDAENVIIVVGTPIDEHLNPDARAVPNLVESLRAHLRDGQMLVLRSTIYPGVTALVERTVERLGLSVEVAFCPERIAQGSALHELPVLPQIVSGRTDEVVERAARLFQTLTPDIVRLSPEEAELAKLFTNTWRYVQLATANQLYMIANDFDLDYERIRTALTFRYPRASDLPRAGFAAGPCLLKDTMQLAAFNNNNFPLGHASMTINEGLPLYVVARLERRFDLSSMCVGILGMAFKAGSDDTRSSLSYKLRRILRFKAADVACTDPHVSQDESLEPIESVLGRADVLILGVPHAEYRDLVTDKPIIDLWGDLGGGVRV